MVLADINIVISGDSKAFTPEFEATFEKFEEMVDNLIESMRDEFGSNVKVTVQ